MSTALQRAMREVAHAVEAELDRVLPRGGTVPPVLADAMRHACLGGGKRLRPFLTVVTGRLFGAEETALLRAGTALPSRTAASMTCFTSASARWLSASISRPSTSTEMRAPGPMAKALATSSTIDTLGGPE